MEPKENIMEYKRTVTNDGKVIMENRKNVLDIERIQSLLPHRSPILLVDKVLDYTLGENIHAIKNISICEPIFAGHFPNKPIYPGVYILEGLAQTSAILSFLMAAEKFGEENIERSCLLTGIQKSRFRKPVMPGDTLNYHVTVNTIRGRMAWFKGHVQVGERPVAEAEFSAYLGQDINM